MNLAEQYRVVTEGAGWIDRSNRGRLKFEGADTLPFLQALVTNDVSALSEGRGVYAAYLTPQGRMIADIEFYHRGGWVMGNVVPGLSGPLVQRFDGLVFAEDVRISDISAELGEIVMVGRAAATAAAAVTGVDVHVLEMLSEFGQSGFSGGFVVRDADLMAPAYKIIFDEAASAIRDRVRTHVQTTISPDLFETLRIEAGRPLFGVDMTEETIPLEAGLLDRAISTTKGCYVGQEIVIRILHRGGGRVAKRLVTLAVDTPALHLPSRGTPVLLDGRDVGRVTSAASARDGRSVVAMGYVSRELAEPGVHVTLQIEGNPAAIITSLAG